MLVIKGNCPACRGFGIHKKNCSLGDVSFEVKTSDDNLTQAASAKAAGRVQFPSIKTLESVKHMDRYRGLGLTLHQAFTIAEWYDTKPSKVAEVEPDPEQKQERIYTRCPACGFSTLIVNKGHLLCTLDSCPDPTLIDRGYDKKGS